MTLVFADFVNLHNSRVLKLGNRFSFQREASDHRLTGMLAGQDHFDGDKTIQTQMPGLVNDSHAPHAELTEDFVTGQRYTLGQGRESIIYGRRLLGPIVQGRRTFREGVRSRDQLAQRRQGAAELRIAGQQGLAVHGPTRLEIIQGGIERRRRLRIEGNCLRQFQASRIRHSSKPSPKPKDEQTPRIAEPCSFPKPFALIFRRPSCRTSNRSATNKPIRKLRVCSAKSKARSKWCRIFSAPWAMPPASWKRRSPSIKQSTMISTASCASWPTLRRRGSTIAVTDCTTTRALVARPE